MQTFAAIPAAGRSQRMGRPKLLLPWGDTTLIEHVLSVWRASRVDRVLVVVSPLDGQLAELAAAAGADVVRPETAPADMKASVQRALVYAARFAPQATDAWLVAPADMPGLKVETINALVDAYVASVRAADTPPRIWVPRHGARRGHPVLFPWSLAGEVAQLAPGEGLNALLARHEVAHLEAGAGALVEDLDTPDDYERLRPRDGT